MSFALMRGDVTALTWHGGETSDWCMLELHRDTFTRFFPITIMIQGCRSSLNRSRDACIGSCVAFFECKNRNLTEGYAVACRMLRFQDVDQIIEIKGSKSVCHWCTSDLRRMSLRRCCFLYRMHLMNLLRVCSKCNGRLNDKTLTINAIGYEVCTLLRCILSPVCSQVCALYIAYALLLNRIRFDDMNQERPWLLPFQTTELSVGAIELCGRILSRTKSKELRFSRSILRGLWSMSAFALNYGESQCQEQALNETETLTVACLLASTMTAAQKYFRPLRPNGEWKKRNSSDAERKRMHLVDNVDNKHIACRTTFIRITAIQTNGQVI